MAKRHKTAKTTSPDANGEAAPKPNSMATLPELRRQLEEVQPFVISLARQIEALSLAALQGDPEANAKVAALDKDRRELLLKKELLQNAVRELEGQEQERERAAKLDRMTRRNAQGVKTIGPILMDQAPQELPRERFDQLMQQGMLQEELRYNIQTFYDRFPKHLEAWEVNRKLEENTPLSFAISLISNLVMPPPQAISYDPKDLKETEKALAQQNKEAQRRQSLVLSLAQELLLHAEPIPPIPLHVEQMRSPQSARAKVTPLPRYRANRPMEQIEREMRDNDAELARTRDEREAKERKRAERDATPARGALVFGNVQASSEAAE
jgi:hypothetical protein